MGIKILKEDEDIGPEDHDLLQVVIGKVKDIRDFQEDEIKEWVNQLLITNESIRVKKVSKLFFFICSDMRNIYNLASVGSANYQGALFLFAKCQPRASFRSINFQRAPIWIRVEGQPLIYNKAHIARKALERIGRVLYFDNPSSTIGIKDYLRAKVTILINNPLVPGFYFISEKVEPYWIDFKYEGVFVYCNKCGRIGHKRPRCRLSFETSQCHFQTIMGDIGQGMDQSFISPTFHPLFSNKLIGLKRIQRNRITQVNLIDFSWERDEEGDNPSKGRRTLVGG